MIRGADVLLYVRTKNGEDEFHAPVWRETPVMVHNVLIGEPDADAVVSDLQLCGRRLAYVLAIPKGDTHDWDGVTVEMFSAPEDLERETRRFFDSIAKFPKPIIAQVSGPCVGEAFAALLYCDLVYVSPQALFSLPAVALARTPRYGAAQIMAAAAGYPAAAEKLLLSEPISADEAQAMRLITRVIDDEHLDQVVAAKTARLAVLPPGAVAGTKALLAAARRKALADLTDYEENLYARQARSPEAAEALKAFLEGRKPIFKTEDDPAEA